MAKQKTLNPFNNHGFSYDAWQSGYDSDIKSSVENPYSLDAGNLRSFWAQGRLAKINDRSFIPQGMYCHGPLTQEGVNENGFPILKAHKMCPYWSNDPNLPDQANGVCSFMGLRDGDIDSLGNQVWLLWDQVKECGINDEDDPDEESCDDS